MKTGFNLKQRLLHFFVLSALLTPVVFGLSGCVSQPSKPDNDNDSLPAEQAKASSTTLKKQKFTEQEMKNLPGWVVTPPSIDATGFYGVGMASDRDLMGSMNQAKQQASVALANTIKSNLTGKDDALINDFFEKMSLSNAQVVKQKVEPVNGIYKSYVLMKYSFHDFSQLVKASKLDADEKMRLQEAYRQLMKKVGNE